MPMSSRQVRDAMVLTSRNKRLPTREGLIPIGPGAWLPESLLRTTKRSWERAELIAKARAWACLHSHAACAPVGLTAALLADLPLAATPRECSLAARDGRRSQRFTLPAVVLDGMVIAPEQPCRVRRIRGGLARRPVVDYASDEFIEDALITILLLEKGEQAFVAACSALRRLVIGNANRWTPRRRSEWKLKESLRARLDAARRHCPGAADARWMLANAEAGCESVGEARLLWILRSCGVGGTRVQFQVSDGFEEYYLDIAIPELEIALEFDGRAKYGVTAEEQAIAWGDQFERDRFLSNRGWSVLRFSWNDLEDPAGIIERLERAARTRGRNLRRCARARVRAFSWG